MYPYNIFRQEAGVSAEAEKNENKPQRKNKKKPQDKRPQTPPSSQKPPSNMPRPSIIDEKILDMILEAIADERGDAEYYAKLTHMAKSQEEKNILNGIRMDEQKHEKIFRRIYSMLTGKEASVETKLKKVGNNLRDEYRKSVFEELETVEFYKKMYIALKSQDIRNMLYDIITDEQSHATKLTYLLTT